MPIPGRYTHGPWELTKPSWSEPWVARHTTTGETVNTGENHVEQAKATLPTEPAKTGPAVGFTLAVSRSTAPAHGYRRTRPAPAVEEVTNC